LFNQTYPVLDTEPYPAAGLLINAENINLEFFIGLIILFLLITVSALVSGSEVAFFSLTPSDVDLLKKKKTKSADKLIQLLQKPKSLLGTILISNNLVNIAIVVLSASLTNMVFDFGQSPIVGFLVKIVGITFILLLFGEIIPKVYATHNGIAFAQTMTLPMTALSVFFRPVSSLLVKGTRIIDSRVKKKETISFDELSDAIDLTSNVTTDEEDILKGIVEFSTIEASEIMKPRVDIVTVDIKTNFKSLLQVITIAGYSRMPVYHNSLDNIKGILYIKDLLPHLEKPETFGWQSLIRPPYFVPENKRVNELLEELQEKHIHMAIVVDEYGGTSGIVTLEDVIEEIIGEISDEFDEEERNHARINENTYLFEGKISINDFCRIVGYDGDLFNDVNADTLAGLVLEQTGEMPKQFDTINIDRFEFKVESVDNRRIKKIQVKIQPET
jgi:gliding motility-associated protein GldE